MRLFTRRAMLAALLSLAVATPAFAAIPKLGTTLTGLGINGRIPEVKAKVDQKNFPREAPELQVEVENVHLPNGTVLAVFLNGQQVGTLNLALGSARLNTTIATAIEPSAALVVTLNGMPILANPGVWKP